MPPTTTAAQTRRVTHIDGVEVITIEQAYGPHPRWPDRQAAFAGVSWALLADDTERFLCDGEPEKPCDFIGSSTRQVVSHRNGTHNRRKPHGPMYLEATIRAVLREVAKAKKDHARGFCEQAAAELNRLGVPTVQGRPWTSGSVSNVHNRYKDKYRVRQVAAAAPAGRKAPARRVVDDVQVLRQWVMMAVPVAQALERVLDQLDVPPVDPEVIEKARRFDEMQRLMGRGQAANGVVR